MERIVKYASAVSAVGTYCSLSAYLTLPPSALVPASGVQLAVPSMLAACSLVAVANAGTTAGSVVPVVLGPDGNYYPLSAPVSTTAAGFLFSFQMNSPNPGVAIQIVTLITGGTLNLFCSAITV